MGFYVQIDDNQKILLKRHLNKNGAAQRFFVSEFRKAMDPYVPMQSGTLKNQAQEKPSSVVFISPYARRQLHENKGKGLRGKMWHVRCWADRGNKIIASVAKFAGGKAG